MLSPCLLSSKESEGELGADGIDGGPRGALFPPNGRLDGVLYKIWFVGVLVELGEVAT